MRAFLYLVVLSQRRVDNALDWTTGSDHSLAPRPERALHRSGPTPWGAREYGKSLPETSNSICTIQDGSVAQLERDETVKRNRYGTKVGTWLQFLQIPCFHGGGTFLHRSLRVDRVRGAWSKTLSLLLLPIWGPHKSLTMLGLVEV